MSCYPSVLSSLFFLYFLNVHDMLMIFWLLSLAANFFRSAAPRAPSHRSASCPLLAGSLCGRFHGLKIMLYPMRSGMICGVEMFFFFWLKYVKIDYLEIFDRKVSRGFHPETPRKCRLCLWIEQENQGYKIKHWKKDMTGWWYTYPSEKWWTSSVGIITSPTEWKVIIQPCSEAPTRWISRDNPLQRWHQ